MASRFLTPFQIKSDHDPVALNVAKTLLNPIQLNLIEAEGGSYLSQEMARTLRTTVEDLESRRVRNEIIGLPVDGSFLYPKWQVVKRFWVFDVVVPGLDRVLDALGDRSPWTKAAFMLDQGIRPEFPTPLAGLRNNQIDLVIAAAQSYGEHGAS
jgi:hypothetical protein